MQIPPARWVAIAGTLCISFSGIFVALSGATPITSAFFRLAYALPVLVAIGWIGKRTDPRTTRQRVGAFGAGVPLAVDLFFYHSAIDHIGAGLATVAAHTQVVFVGALGWVLYRQLPTKRTAGFATVIFSGVVLLSGLGAENAYGDDPLTGVWMGILAGALYAGFLVALQASNVGGRGSTVRVLVDASVGGLVAAAAIGGLTGTLDLAPSWPGHGWLLALALLIQVAGWAALTYALPRLAALTVSVIILGQPMLAVVWGWVFLEERLSITQTAGVALVVVGLTAVNAQRDMVVRSVEPARAGVLRPRGEQTG
jgi:drug/metabolite transporter (DMT)-like permease